MVFVSCSEEEPATPSSENIQLNITVANIGPDEPVTRASIKEVWDSGDEIKIWYDSNTSATPDLVITYNGSEWKGPESITPPSKSNGYVKCLYDGRVKVVSKADYTYDSTSRTNRKFSFNIESWTCLTELVVVVTDIPQGTDASLYTLACDKFTPLSGDGYTVGTDSITATKGTKGAAVAGFASYIYEGAAAFALATADYSASAQDFKFTLTNTTTNETKVRTENVTLVSSTKIKTMTLTCYSFLNHEAVQLWEGGPYWATTNIGASTPEEYGYYFAWGDTQGYVRNSASDGWVKATDASSSITFDEVGFPDYQTHAFSDMAEANWGADWKVPEKADFENLLSKCDIEYVTTGTKGIKFKGKGSYSGRSIFLPAASFGIGSELYKYINNGVYWAIQQKDSSDAYHFQFRQLMVSNDAEVIWGAKYRGYTVRPVSVTGPVPVTAITLNKTEASIYVDYTETLSISSIEPSIATLHVTWSSSDTGVATVDENGVVTGVALGTATITAMADDGVKATCTVKVVTPKTGDYVNVNGQGGVVYFYDSKPYMISLDWTYCDWDDGKKWCENKGDGWYLPSKDEFKAIYKVRGTLNATLSAYGANQLGTATYWTSNDIAALYSADLFYFSDGHVGRGALKALSYYVRAVRAL